MTTITTDKPVLLNLGCGHKHFPQEEGWINVDYSENSSGQNPDVAADLRKLPFPDNYADEIHSIHSIEHLYIWEAVNVIRHEWRRVLKPQGLLVIECPSMNKILNLFKIPDISHRFTWWGLYGDPRSHDPNMMHKWCWSQEMLCQLLTDTGYVDVKVCTPKYHYEFRDMRIEAKKGEL